MSSNTNDEPLSSQRVSLRNGKISGNKRKRESRDVGDYGQVITKKWWELTTKDELVDGV